MAIPAARPPRRDPARFDRVLVCTIGGGRFGLPAGDLLGLLPARNLRPFPHGPAVAQALTTFRGEQLPVIDLRAQLGLPPRDPHAPAALAAIAAGPRHLAVLVDAAHDVVARSDAPNVALLDPLSLIEPDDAWRLEQALRTAGIASGPAAKSGTDLELVAFALSGERFAIDAALVRGSFRLEELRAIPHAPRQFAGCTTLEGEAVPVIELRRVFGIPSTGLHDNARLLALGKRRVEFGVMADEIADLLRLRADALRPAGTVRPEMRGLVRGRTPDGALALHGEALLHDPRLMLA
jgi:purine-binding chemotaxis protein CheW